MKKIINLEREGHALSPWKKYLLLINQLSDTEGIYKVITSPGAPIYISYDNETKSALSIDFDGGPFLRVGSKVKDYSIKEFLGRVDFGTPNILLTSDTVSS